MKQLILLTTFLLSFFFGMSQTKEQDSLIIQLAFQKDNIQKVETSIKLIQSFYTRGEYTKATNFIAETEKLALTLNYKKGIAEMKYSKASIYAKLDDYYNALDNYNRSLNIFIQIEDSIGIAKTNNSLGLIEIKKGNYDNGLKYSLAAIRILEAKGLKEELGAAYDNLSEAYSNTNKIDKALDFSLRALKVKQELRNPKEINKTIKRIADLYSLRKEHRKAIEYYQIALSSLDTLKEQELRGFILPSIGREYLHFKEFDQSEQFLEKGLKINRTIGHKKNMLFNLNTFAYLRLQQNEVSVAQDQINEAYEYTKHVKDDGLLLETLRLKYTIDSLNGNYKNAFSWQGKYHSLKSKLEKEKISLSTFKESDTLKLTSLDFDNNYKTSSWTDFSNSKPIKYMSLGFGALLLILVFLLGNVLLTEKNKKKHIIQLSEENKQYQLENETITQHIKELEEINHSKDRLFSIVSHDLKDSISSVKTFLDLLKKDDVSKKEFNEMLPELSDNADNASALLINLLNWSKSQMQNLNAKPKTFNIQDVFNKKIKLIEKKAKKKQIVIIDKSIKDDVYADENMVEIIIQNLLANAVKFSRIGDVITFSNRVKNNKALIRIEDTGVGISKENQKKIFLNGGFTTKGTDSEKGTGLGLAICKQLVELNNGKIWVESEPSLGSTFFVELPREKS